ncbi:MAG: hypothetical protein Q7U82_16805 [Gammaproteobacteria bacterium]|nr:hypothetical protein [Gammaproteobacteria bacterium]
MTDSSAIKLTKLKEMAQSPITSTSALAQFDVKDHLFELSGNGRHPFAFILSDGWFRIELAKQGAKHTPMAYCRIASELLTTRVVDDVVRELSSVIGEIGVLSEVPNVSRADLCVDFVTTYPIDQIQIPEFVTKARTFAQHTDDRQFSGFSIAPGGTISARLYNKNLELKKNPRPYIQELWRQKGWDGVSTVWRMEFQYRRDVLRDLGVVSYFDLSQSLAGLWRYSVHDWLRHTVPSLSDKTQSRWPLSSLWQALQGVSWTGFEHLERVNFERSRTPSDRTLFINGLSPLTSFMAREGYLHAEEAFPAFLQAAQDFHNGSSERTGVDFKNYVSNKVSEKRRFYNTGKNKPLNGGIHPADKAVADEYRKQSDGDY